MDILYTLITLSVLIIACLIAQLLAIKITAYLYSKITKLYGKTDYTSNGNSIIIGFLAIPLAANILWLLLQATTFVASLVIQ